MVLIQIKGGGARGPTEDDCRRPRKVQRHYRAKTVVLFEWHKGESSEFFELDKKLKWKPTTREALFG